MNMSNHNDERPPPEVMPEGPKVRIDPQGRLSGAPKDRIDPQVRFSGTPEVNSDL